jgi:hypothetical protein
VVIVEIRPHFNVGDSVERYLFEGFPMKALEKPGVLMLHGCEEFMATQSVRGGHGFIDQSGTQRTESVITRL